MARTFLDKAGLDALWTLIKTAVNTLVEMVNGKADKSHTHTIADVTNLQTNLTDLKNQIYRLQEFGYNYDDFSETDLLWKPSTDCNLGQEGFYSVASTCTETDVRLWLPDTNGTTYDDANYSQFNDNGTDDYEFFERRFQYYSFYNATDHEITLTLCSDEFPIIIKDKVTSFTIPAGGLIEFCAKYVDIAPSMDNAFGNDYAYMVTYTQYF
ncbi:MAG TPA: hypothetical protein DIW30_01870 [Bacteroidales bacterium]|nr:hypothetical protein [Bacteroidales bacterium]